MGHGESYLHQDDILWWSKGGKLHGTSPERIGFLRRILEEAPSEGLNPVKSALGRTLRGYSGAVLFYHFGFNRPSYRHFHMNPGVQYRVDVIDTWNMTIQELLGTFEGSFRIELPGWQYMAVRLRKA